MNPYSDKKKQPVNIDTQYGKVPPQAIEVEEAVLGAVMLERDAIFKVTPIIQSEAFYKEEHQKIFSTVEELAAGSHNIDLLTVTRQLKDKGILDQVGGPAFITHLTRRVASAAHIEQHARIIAEKYFQREMIRRFSELINTAYTDSIDELEMMYSMHTQAIDALLAGKSGMMHIRDILLETTNDLERRQVLAEKGETPGITTGLADLNTLNNGWQAGDLVIIDYLQLVESPESYTHKNRERAVAEISHGLKKVAKASGIPVILLAQLTAGWKTGKIKHHGWPICANQEPLNRMPTSLFSRGGPVTTIPMPLTKMGIHLQIPFFLKWPNTVKGRWEPF
jgi:replicative DNA helicase